MYKAVKRDERACVRAMEIRSSRNFFMNYIRESTYIVIHILIIYCISEEQIVFISLELWS